MPLTRRIFFKVCAVGVSLATAVIEACSDDTTGGGYSYGDSYSYGYGAAGPLQRRIRQALDRFDVAGGAGRRVG